MNRRPPVPSDQIRRQQIRSQSRVAGPVPGSRPIRQIVGRGDDGDREPGQTAAHSLSHGGGASTASDGVLEGRA
jgi:hypothetical protein